MNRIHISVKNYDTSCSNLLNVKDYEVKHIVLTLLICRDNSSNLKPPPVTYFPGKIIPVALGLQVDNLFIYGSLSFGGELARNPRRISHRNPRANFCKGRENGKGEELVRRLRPYRRFRMFYHILNVFPSPTPQFNSGVRTKLAEADTRLGFFF